MTAASANERSWWGEFSLGRDERGFWRVGPLSLAITRAASEWRIERSSVEDSGWPEARFEVPSGAVIEEGDVQTSRYSVDEDDGQLRLTPLLADRAVVVSPESPFFVPAEQHITLFCSTPLWIRVDVGGKRLKLEEFPVLRPPDTWFGPSTRVGELCYATRTGARLRREDLQTRCHRAFTELRIHNQADSTLHLEKFNLSVPYFSLYARADGQLWTDVATLTRTENQMSELEIGDGPPEWLDAERVGDSRRVRGSGLMVRAFGHLFSSGG